MPLSELLDETFRVYRKYFVVIAGVSIAVLIPGLITSLMTGSFRVMGLATGAFTSLGDPQALESLGEQIQSAQSADPVWTVINLVVSIVLLPFTFGAVWCATSLILSGHPVTVASVLRTVLRRYWAVFGMVILFFLFTAVAVWIFPLWLWIVIRWIVAPYGLFAEGLGPIRAFGRSWNLAAGQWWRTLGIVLVLLIMLWIISSALSFLFVGIAALIPGVGSDVRGILVTVASELIHALISPVLAVALTLLYFDLRVRKEGLDLEQLARATSPPSV